MNDILRYNRPARIWDEALPIGNGKFGAMVYGGFEAEKLSLNLDTFWSDTVRDDVVEDKSDKLNELRELLLNENYTEAEKYAKEYFTYDKDASIYLPVGDIYIERIDGGYFRINDGELLLDMKNAEVREKYYYHKNKGVQLRKTYISNPDDVLVSEFNSDLECDFKIYFSTNFKHSITEYNNGIGIKCTAPSTNAYLALKYPLLYNDNSVSYGLRINAYTDGEVVVDSNCIFVYGAKQLSVVAAGETNFVSWDKYPDKTKDLLSVTSERIEKAVKKGLDLVYNNHIDYHKNLYDRVSIDIAETTDEFTDVLREKYINGVKDDALLELMFNYGRYLLIASSSPDSQAANLQGIWNNLISPPWMCDFTSNINLEMNYWHAETCNLSECHIPMINLIKDISISGEKTAKDFYNCGGFVCHHNIDLWRKTTPASGKPKWAVWPMCGAWLCQHLWTHYEYTLDVSYLKETAYPIMKKAARFFLDFLIEDKDGYLVTAPSTSPENRFLYDGEECAVSKMSTMDHQLLEELFGNILKASKVLGDNDEILTEIEEAIKKFPPYKVGSNGQLLEWEKEFQEPEPGHRHQSMLYGIYPSRVLHRDVKLFNAGRKSLEIRLANGGGYTGWSCAWIINLYAAFKDGEKSKEFIDKLITDSTYPNLFDAHPPFQIDGNFGFTAGVSNMLLQSYENDGQYVLEILPACPKCWKKGSISGLRTVGGMEADIIWDNQKVSVKIKNKCGADTKNIVLKFSDNEFVTDIKKELSYKFDIM